MCSTNYTAQLGEAYKATECFQARLCVLTIANSTSLCSANHLGVCFEYEICAEAGVSSIHVRNVQLAQEAAAAQQVLAADILQESSLVCILPQLLLHQAVVKPIHLVPESEPCGPGTCCRHVQRCQVRQNGTPWFQPPACCISNWQKVPLLFGQVAS